MDSDKIIELQEEVINLQSALNYQKDESAKALTLAKRAHAAQIEVMKATIVKEKDAEISRLTDELSSLTGIAELRANLYAFSDTFHLAAKRIVETENPAEEAATLKTLADQLLQAVGLPPRKEDE